MDKCISTSAAEPHHFYAVPAPSKNVVAALEAPALAPAPTYYIQSLL
jgi:hypothetical protein